MMSGLKTLEKNKNILKVLPFIAFMAVFYMYGIFYGIMSSFGYNKVVGTSGFTLENYTRIFSDRGFINSVVFTLKISIIAAVIAIFLALCILYVIYINMKEKYFYPEVFQKLVELPLLVPYIIAGYAILICFMQSGLISTLAVNLGIIDSYHSFPILTNDPRGIGIIMAYVWKSIPFVVMTCIPILTRIMNKWDSLGKVYNLSNFSFYRKIILPIMFPTIVVSFFMIFSYFIVSFEAPYLLGVTSPRSIAVYIFDLYRRGSLAERGIVMGMNVLLLLLNLVCGYLIYLFLKKYSKYDEKGWE